MSESLPRDPRARTALRTTALTAAVTLLLGALGAVGAVSAAPGDSPETLVVDAEGDFATDGTYQSISAAIAAASAGDTIEVGAGTYAENVDFPQGSKDITLRGAGQDETIIVPARAWDSTNNGIAIRAGSSGITIRDLTVDGGGNDDLGEGEHFRDGLWWEGAGGATTDPVDRLANDVTVIDVTVRNVDRRGVSVWPTNVTGTHLERITVENVTGWQSGNTNGGMGIKLNGAGSLIDSTVRNTRFAVSGDSRAVATEPIILTGNLIDGLRGTEYSRFNIGFNFWVINRNPVTATGNTVIASAPGNSGIYLVDPGAGTQISDNTLTLSGQGGIGIETGWSASGAEIDGNTITMGAKGAGIVVTGTGGASAPVEITDNTLRNSSTSGLQSTDLSTNGHWSDSAREVGIIVSGAKGTSRTGDASAATTALVEGNSVRGFSHALALVEDAADKLTVQVTRNSFTTPAGTGLPVLYGTLATSSPYAYTAITESTDAADLSLNHWGGEGLDASAISASAVGIVPAYADAAFTQLVLPTVEDLRVEGTSAAIVARWSAPTLMPEDLALTGLRADLVSATGTVVSTQSLEPDATQATFAAPSKSTWYRVEIALLVEAGSGAPTASSLVRIGSGAALDLETVEGGAPVVGERVEVLIDADWDPFPTSFAYAWSADGKAIKGATKSWFTPTSSEVGKQLTVKVTGTVSGSKIAQVRYAAATDDVTAAEISSVNAPVVSGAAVVGGTVKVTTGSWSTTGVTYAYQWFVDGTAIKSATKSSYTIASSYAGRELSVRVTASRAGYTSAQVTVDADVVLGAQSPTTPKITGTARVGTLLTATSSSVPASVTVSYEWFRTVGKTRSAIPGADSAVYTVAAADQGATLSVTATWERDGFAPASKASSATKKVVAGPITAVTPVISGTASAGKALIGAELTVDVSGWTPGSATVTVQWFRDGAPIAGADETAYTVLARDLGKRITVTVTGAEAGFTTVARTSAAIQVVPAV